jgi:hypothetical protein
VEHLKDALLRSQTIKKAEKRLAGNKRSSLLDPFVSNEENKVSVVMN